jgi:hypothetical protein
MSRLFVGIGIRSTVKHVCCGCSLCSYNNPGPQLPPLVDPIQRQGSYQGEDWQIGITPVYLCQGYKQLLVFIDTFTGWIEAFPTWTGKASKVAMTLLKEIISKFGLPEHSRAIMDQFYLMGHPENCPGLG